MKRKTKRNRSIGTFPLDKELTAPVFKVYVDVDKMACQKTYDGLMDVLEQCSMSPFAKLGMLDFIKDEIMASLKNEEDYDDG